MATWAETKRQRLAGMTADERAEHDRRDAAVRLALAVGDAVRYRREELGLTQRQLAQMMGTSQPKVSRLEAGEDNVTLATLQRAAQALGVDPAALLARPDVTPTPRRRPTPKTSTPKPRKAAG
jgi:ribosome-binding protein aMBF1 (putative translation factor)